jgi:hypothetical protein
MISQGKIDKYDFIFILINRVMRFLCCKKHFLIEHLLLIIVNNN